MAAFLRTRGEQGAGKNRKESGHRPYVNRMGSAQDHISFEVIRTGYYVQGDSQLTLENFEKIEEAIFLHQKIFVFP